MGYLLDVAQTSMKKQKKLPEFKDYVKLFVEGIKQFVILLIYLIPVIILALITGFSAAIGFGEITITLILLIIVGLVIGYIATGAVLRYAEKRKFSEAFNFKQITKKIFTQKFFGGWIISIVIAGVIKFVLGFIPIIGNILGAAIAGIFYMSVIGEAYSEA